MIHTFTPQTHSQKNKHIDLALGNPCLILSPLVYITNMAPGVVSVLSLFLADWIKEKIY